MNRRSQKGITLIVSLIMLVLLTIIGLTTMNIGKSDLQLVDNAQQRGIAMDSAQAIIDQVISSPTFQNAPTAVLDNSNCPASVSAPANSRCNDVYGDGRTIVLVTLSPAPRFLQAVPISCGGGLTEDRQDSFGVAGAPASVVSGSCYEALWEVTAVATEIKSGAQAVVTQGVKLQTSGAACI